MNGAVLLCSYFMQQSRQTFYYGLQQRCRYLTRQYAPRLAEPYIRGSSSSLYGSANDRLLLETDIPTTSTHYFEP